MKQKVWKRSKKVEGTGAFTQDSRGGLTRPQDISAKTSSGFKNENDCEKRSGCVASFLWHTGTEAQTEEGRQSTNASPRTLLHQAQPESADVPSQPAPRIDPADESGRYALPAFPEKAPYITIISGAGLEANSCKNSFFYRSHPVFIINLRRFVAHGSIHTVFKPSLLN